jgi:hypothetical protein
MFDNLLDLVKQNAGSAIINNPAIPNQHNDDAINTTSNSIMNSLTQQAAGGNMNQLMNMFQQGATQNNPVVTSVQTLLPEILRRNLISTIMQRVELQRS